MSFQTNQLDSVLSPKALGYLSHGFERNLTRGSCGTEEVPLQAVDLSMLGMMFFVGISLRVLLWTG
jgi:hypothetical protein